MTMGFWRRAAGWFAAAFLAGAAAAQVAPTETAPPPAAAAAAGVEPAIWTIKKANGATITLFGSVHILPGGEKWRTEALTAAYKAADVVVFETNLEAMQDSDLQAYLVKNAMNPAGVTLTSLLSPEQKETVTKGAAVAGVSFSAMDGFRPWFAALQISVAYAVSQGFSPDQGVDKTIEGEAKADGKALDYFEKAREQLDLFIELPEKQQIDFLVLGAQELIDKPDELKKLVDAWARGDVAAIDDLMNEGLEDSPEVAKKLLEDRNRSWVEKIETFYMKDKNSYLIVVGAGHLAGEKGVPAMLRDEGVEVAGP